MAWSLVWVGQATCFIAHGMQQSTHTLGPLQGGFNRWTHKKKFGPLRMTPPTGEGGHFSADVKVPRSAHSVDFVLSNAAEGESEGVFDNRGGLDYHLPLDGSEVQFDSCHHAGH